MYFIPFDFNPTKMHLPFLLNNVFYTIYFTFNFSFFIKVCGIIIISAQVN